MRLDHGQTPESYPRVYTENSCYEPESVHKHTWGIVMIGRNSKQSLPWHKVEGITEELPEVPEEYRDLGASERIY